MSEYTKVKFKGGWALVHNSDIVLLSKYPRYTDPVEHVASIPVAHESEKITKTEKVEKTVLHEEVKKAVKDDVVNRGGGVRRANK